MWREWLLDVAEIVKFWGIRWCVQIMFWGGFGLGIGAMTAWYVARKVAPCP